jgi:hypothetical protein
MEAIIGIRLDEEDARSDEVRITIWTRGYLWVLETEGRGAD